MTVGTAEGGPLCRKAMSYSSLFLNSACDIRENNGQRHATLAFLKIDRLLGNPPSNVHMQGVKHDIASKK